MSGDHDTSYPVRVRGELATGLSRGLWLVKWLLAIPHYLLLAILWVAVFGVSVIAFFAILVTGRYPRALFDFTVGVLRWSWRVAFYSYAALGTDRYPPFSLAADPDYPADLDVEYPERLSRGLVLVKWWLLAIPHYVVVSILTGSFTWGREDDSPWLFMASGGLIGILVIVAAVALLFRGRYPSSVFDFVLGCNRWVVRVMAYAGLLTDRYPPFRLDQGRDEPGVIQSGPIEPGVIQPGGLEPSEPETGVPAPAPVAFAAPAASRWTAGRVLAVVLGSIAALIGAGVVVGGAAVIVVDQTQRDDDGYVMSPSETFSSDWYAVVSESVDVALEGEEALARSFVGTVKIESQAVRPVFVGIARATDVASYLGDVQRSVVTEIGRKPRYDERPGVKPAAPPGEQTFWATSVTGAGTQTLTWEPESGDWVAVLMNPDASAVVRARLSIGAELDPLLWIGLGTLVVGIGLFLLGAVGIALATSRARRG